ncbi:MAG: LamG domain-containing protein, partial [Chlorobiales bacterium]|nr:LamG domain-containing protein [Chlorobiales bacterium]
GRPIDDRFWNSYGIIGGEVGGHVHDYSVGISGNAITFGVGLPKPEAVGTPWESTRNNQTLIAENAINDTDWHHIAVTRDVVSGEMAIFIDGELAMNEIPDPCYVPDPNDPNDLAPLVEVPAIAMGPTGYKDAPATLIIGAQRFNPKSGMMERSVAGELDDLKFYNYVLTADEIKNLLFKSMDAWYPMEAGESYRGCW